MDQFKNKTTNEWLLQVACGKTCPTSGALLFAWQKKNIVWVVQKPRTEYCWQILFVLKFSVCWIDFPSPVLSVLSTSPVLFTHASEKECFFHSHEITQVVVLYTSLWFVEGVYKPQWACVSWASVTELCLKACMGIKHTCLDEFPPDHP